jgi:Tol biopolymer transport system component
MKVSARQFVSALLCLAIAATGFGQDVGPSTEERIASGTGLLASGAARPAWSTQGDWIAYDKRGSDGYSDLYIAMPDGSYERCLTCEQFVFRQQHAGNADWHPSGDYLVFQTERPHRYSGETAPFLAVPGRNRGDAIWVISVRGRDLWKLLDRSEQGGRLHSPRFSWEGDRITWSERLASGGALWGDWVVQVGDFRTNRGVPRVTGVTALEPGVQKAFYETAGFTPDDRHVLLAGNLIEGQPLDGLDIYAVDIESREVRQLTKSISRWERFPLIAPDGKTLVWSSSEAMRRPPAPLAREDPSGVVALDLWIGAMDGSWSRKLTGFNDPLSEEYSGAVMVGPSAWNPSGDKLLITITPIETPEHSDIFILNLSRPFGPTGLQVQ